MFPPMVPAHAAPGCRMQPLSVNHPKFCELSSSVEACGPHPDYKLVPVYPVIRHFHIDSAELEPLDCSDLVGILRVPSRSNRRHGSSGDPLILQGSIGTAVPGRYYTL